MKLRKLVYYTHINLYPYVENDHKVINIKIANKQYKDS